MLICIYTIHIKGNSSITSIRFNISTFDSVSFELWGHHFIVGRRSCVYSTKNSNNKVYYKIIGKKRIVFSDLVRIDLTEENKTILQLSKNGNLCVPDRTAIDLLKRLHRCHNK